MKPVRVKYCGLVGITRPTYLGLQFILFLLCVAMIVVGLSVMHRTGVYIPHVPDMKVQDDLIYQMLITLFWLGLLGLIAGSIETVIMLRKFSRARAAQRASLENVESTPPPPPSTAASLPPNEIPNTNIQP